MNIINKKVKFEYTYGGHAAHMAVIASKLNWNAYFNAFIGKK